MAMSPSAEHHVLGTRFSRSHAGREQGSSATVLLDCCYLSWGCCTKATVTLLLSKRLWESWGFPTSPPFLFFMKKAFRNFSFLWQLVSWVIRLFSHMILHRHKSMSPSMSISPLSPKLNQWLGLSLSSQSLFMGPVHGCDWFDASERQPSW
jgi:hypothetical protein